MIMAGHSPQQFKDRLYYSLVAAGGLVVLMGLYAAHMMEEHGHIITGMNNQIVWGIPHVFAIFMIVAASGVLNVASIGSVFGKAIYKARAPLASLLSIALLAGGLTVLMLDLGRPERIIVAATHYNPTSVFAWNVLLYSGMFAAVAIYLWTMMEQRMNPWIQAGRHRGVRVALHTHHRHRADLRLSGGQAGLWFRLAAADVHRHFLRLGTGGISRRPIGHIRMEWKEAHARDRQAHEEPAGYIHHRRVVSGCGLSPDQSLFRASIRVRAFHPGQTAGSTRNCSGGVMSCSAICCRCC